MTELQRRCGAVVRWLLTRSSARRTGPIVAIVGPDGSGKTTQARLLAERLRETGRDARYVHALYHLSDGIPFAGRLRRWGGPRRTRTERRRANQTWYRLRRAVFGRLGYWFALATVVHVSLASDDEVVVFDRYYHQFFDDVYGPSSGRLAEPLPEPDLTIYLVADLDALRRRAERDGRPFDDAYFGSVIDRYEARADDDWLRLDAELPVAMLHERIVTAVVAVAEGRRVDP